MSLSINSSIFSDGEKIPDQYGYTEDNINPPLSIEEVPSSAESLALIMDDPDAMEPAGKIWDHWVIWNIDPSMTSIPENWNPDDASEGENDYGESGYGGPNPPDREHTYYFRLFALDTEITLDPSASADDLRNEMDGHILEEAEFTGTYAP